jgi:hypothetical protein
MSQEIISLNFSPYGVLCIYILPIWFVVRSTLHMVDKSFIKVSRLLSSFPYTLNIILKVLWIVHYECLSTHHQKPFGHVITWNKQFKMLVCHNQCWVDILMEP